MTTRYRRSGPPDALHQALEFRGLLELLALPGAWPLLSRVPKGDGHPVLLLPGFLSGEGPLYPLKAYLRSRGYEVDTWGFGRNTGFHRRHTDALEQKIRFLHHRHGRKVSLVGWSLGGVFAMYGAHHATECVRSVITLGSPVSPDPHSDNTPPMVKALHRMVAHPLGPIAHAAQPRAKKMRSAPPMPVSCLYSISDGVVPAQDATIDGDPAIHENIRVPGSHSGLGFNPVVMWIVADRLAQPEGAWRPFEPSGAADSAYRWMTHAAVPI